MLDRQRYVTEGGRVGSDHKKLNSMTKVDRMSVKAAMQTFNH